jgi:ATP-binding cassette subfamily C (CFTR/MRP) protein 1
VRLEMVGTAIITCACLFAVLEHARRGSMADESFAGTAGLAISFALTVTQSLNWSVRMSSDLEAQMISVERVSQYIENVEPEALLETEADHDLPPDFPKGEIVFKDVEMRYRPGLPLVLKGLNLTIPARSKIGIVGRTGAGKSSIMIALTRLKELDGGNIFIDDVDARKLGLQLIRSKIAVIPQDPLLFAGTIRSNLDPFNKHDDSRLNTILQRVGLMRGSQGDDDAMLNETNNNARLDSLLDEVAEGGNNFSVGQRQLLVIARALLSEATIVIMDEATAAIDVDTDARIQKAMRKEFVNATTLTVAHRLNSILDSDLILVMDDGRAVEFDTPANLRLKKDGLFKELERAYMKNG